MKIAIAKTALCQNVWLIADAVASDATNSTTAIAAVR